MQHTALRTLLVCAQIRGRPDSGNDARARPYVQGLFRLDPADQVIAADRFQQGWMVGGHVPPDHPDHLVIAIAAGHVTAFASDQLHLAPPTLAPCLSVMPGCWRDLGVF